MGESDSVYTIYSIYTYSLYIVFIILTYTRLSLLGLIDNQHGASLFSVYVYSLELEAL